MYFDEYLYFTILNLRVYQQAFSTIVNNVEKTSACG